jgi:O-antigen/teichoic acid export membrane protein
MSSSSSNLIKGTFILTLGTIISKVLGLFYVIPFREIVGGSEPVALYGFGYVPYNIFISISTAGVPLAVAKYIAKHNALEEYAVGRKLFRSSTFIMITSGFVCFLIMYLTAPYFAELVMAGSQKASFGTGDVTTVIRAVSYALIIIPVMSLIRGFFQGHQMMGPSAISQVVEQIVRTIFLIGGAYVVLKVFHGSMVTAISLATFAAFIGGIASLICLFWYWKKSKPTFDELLEHDRGTISVSLGSMYKEIILYALPFVFVGIANSLYQVIDQVTFKRAMEAVHAGNAIADLGVLNFDAHKLVIIPVSLATAFSLTLVPLITESFAVGDKNVLVRSVDQTFQILLFVTIPAAMGLSILAEPVYTLFYNGQSNIGTSVLMHYAPVAILFALYSVTAAILQGINEQRFTILSLLVGLLIKLSLNIPFIEKYHVLGAVYATALGYGVSIIINLIIIKIFANYPFKMIIRRTILIGVFNVIMCVVVIVLYKGLTIFLSPASKFQSFLIIVICGTVGALVYAALGLKSNLADRLFGSRVERIKAMLRLGS